MRLTLDEEPETEGGSRARPEPAGARFGMFGPLYFALWLNASVLAVMVYQGRTSRLLLNPAVQAALWSAGLGFVALVACQGRIALHDLLLTLSVRDQFLLGLLTLIPMVLPATVRGPRILPEGLLWAVPLMLLLAVNPALTRRVLALTLAGAWFAAGRLDGAAGLGLALGFGLTWLAALGAAHFAYTGEPHGLGGTWPVRKVVANAILTAIPAALAGVLAWLAWPKAPPVARDAPLKAPPNPARVITRLDPVERAELIYWGIATLVFTAVLVVILYYIRKWLLKRSARAVAMKLIPGQVTQVEYEAEVAPERPRPHLEGLRGRIVGMWASWAAAAGRAGTPRAPGETAAAYAARMAEPQAPAAMTDLLEKAHYGREAPSKEDAEAMARLVQAELAKMKPPRKQDAT